MVYRSTPVGPTKMSPCQLMMGRQIQTHLPTLEKNLQPCWPDQNTVRLNDKRAKEAYRTNFNRHHGARSLPELKPGDHVLIKCDKDKTWDTPGLVTEKHDAPRSYVWKTSRGTYRRNRRHLQQIPKVVPSEQHVQEPVQLDDYGDEPVPHVFAPPAADLPTEPTVPPVEVQSGYTTKRGRVVVKPQRFRD